MGERKPGLEVHEPAAATRNVFAVLSLGAGSRGNVTLDARVRMDADELLQCLKRATEARAVKQCMRPSPDKVVWADTCGKTLADEFDEQESWSSDGEVPSLRSSGIMEDASEGGTDSEYYAAMEDEDLSDATVRTCDSEGEEDGDSSESSLGDFH